MKEKDYLDVDFRDASRPFILNRREFLKVFGGGIFVFFTLGDAEAYQEGRRRSFPRAPTDFNAFLRIGADGRVACFTGKIEMGQGVITSLAQMLADELNVPFEAVDMVMGDTDLCPWDMGTFGSMTTRFFGPALRAAAAEARTVLKELAAETLQTTTDQVEGRDGVFTHRVQRDKRVTYAELARGKRIERHLKEPPPLEEPGDFTLVGKPLLRTDALEKVTGRAKYAGDIRLPGLLYARIVRPPKHGAKLKSIDSSAAKAMKGVKVIEEGELIAVLHEHPDGAEKALEGIRVEFDSPEGGADDKTIFEHLLKVAPEGVTVSEMGNLQSGEKLASSILEETYFNSYVAHAPIETHTAVAKVQGERATVWASTQTPFRAREEVAQVLGFPQENVRIITPFLGGGFGGKTRNAQAVEAALLAKKSGKPVQVAWSRKEEFFYDTFRPAAVVKIRSGIEDTGRIVLWDYHVYYAGERGSQHFYDIPHHRTVSHGRGWQGPPGSHPFGTGAWRAPANNTNTFARESQIDMMAFKAGADPLEFRVKNLQDIRMRKALTAAGEKFGWTPSKAPSGRGRGIACGIDSGTVVAAVAEVKVDKDTGNVQVLRVVCAQDMGLVINPEGARLQMEGCIIMGLGYALAEEIRFRGGEIFDGNFDTYEIPRFSWLPEIETLLVESKDLSPQGGGEPAIICMGGAIANAVFDATGARIFHLPMTPERIQEAIRKG